MALPQCPQKTLTNQLVFLSKKVLPFLMRQHNAKPFLKPVDYISYGLPDYPNVIKSPIDLNTIKDRLNRKFYAKSIDCLNDLYLMFQNCYVYNGPGEIIIVKGLLLEQELLSKLKSMPTVEFKLTKTLKQHYNPINKNIIPLRKSKLDSKTVSSEIPSIDLPKREKVTNHKMSMPSSDSEKCLTLLNELMSHKYKLSNYLFLKPVDVKSLGLTDYYDVVKCPIDIGTIKHNLESGLYETRTSFAYDIYLMVNNCISYNGVSSDIGMVCKHFQTDFEALFFSIFKEKCFDNVHDDALYFLMRIMRRHKEIEEMIRVNSDKIANSRHRIDTIVNILEDSNIINKKRRKKEIIE